jgi:hypothetical protein
MGAADPDLADGAEEVRLGAAPHAGEVLLQAAEALRGMEEQSGCRLDRFGCWIDSGAGAVRSGGRRTMVRVMVWRSRIGVLQICSNRKHMLGKVSCLRCARAFSCGRRPVSTEGSPM